VQRRWQPAILGLLRASAWFLCEVFRTTSLQLDEIFRSIARGRETVPLPELLEVYPLGQPRRPKESDITREAWARLDERWRQVFASGWTISAAEFDQKTLIAFPEDAATRALDHLRFHPIDLMIAAPSFAAIDAGDALAVLGELHPGYPAFSVPLFLDPYPEHRRARLAQAASAESAHFRRMDTWRLSPYQVDGATPFSMPGTPGGPGCVRAGDVALSMRPGASLMARWPGRCVPLATLLASWIRLQALNTFRVGSPDVMDRIQVDDFVLRRARWRLSRAVFGEDKNPDDSVRRFETWAAEVGAPRYLFASVPEEKPIYLDRKSVLSVSNLLRLTRDAKELTLIEMLPAPNQLWLAGQDERPSVCEIRCLFEDAPASPAT
jgi:hypothetical protein